MSSADFRKACQDLAAREFARHRHAFDQADTTRAFARIDAETQRRTEARSAAIQKRMAKGMSEADANIVGDACFARR